jgi:hypothetical protein
MNAANRGDVAVATDAAEASRGETGRERLVPLFPLDLTTELRARWDAIQRGFVDDPARAVREGDELVAQVIQGLAKSFSGERARLDGELDRGGSASTEARRVALQRYRSFLERLLSL